MYYEMGTKLAFIEVTEKDRKAIVLSRNSAHRREDLMYMFLQIQKTSIMNTEGLQTSLFTFFFYIQLFFGPFKHKFNYQASPSLFVNTFCCSEICFSLLSSY